jgi:hypothetical protein
MRYKVRMFKLLLKIMREGENFLPCQTSRVIRTIFFLHRLVLYFTSWAIFDRLSRPLYVLFYIQRID